MWKKMKLDKFLINKNESLEFALEKIDQNKLGAIFVEDRKKVVGIATDGDIRRILLKKKDKLICKVDSDSSLVA